MLNRTTVAVRFASVSTTISTAREGAGTAACSSQSDDAVRLQPIPNVTSPRS